MRTTRHQMIRTEQPMSNDQLRGAAPSIFATEAWSAMSDRYTFIPTSVIVDQMRAEGFQPFAAMQSRTRIAGKGDFTKHVVRFRYLRNGNQPATHALGVIYPELILTNAHDGGSRYKLDAGLFRLVCLNGLMVSEGQFTQISVRHTGSADGVINATYEVVEQFPRMIESAAQFGQLRLTEPERKAYATAALALRYDEGEAPVTAEQVMRPRRAEDADGSLWSAFNVAQEHLTQGGLRGRTPGTGRRLHTRPVNGISENARLNKALWTLTQEMQRLAA
jgi:uncharacterized protein DUF932